MASQVQYPSYPQLGPLRLATAADIPRLADLSVLGFKDSEIFRFERPQYSDFPQDALASFANIYRSQLRDPRAVVIVAEDACLPNDTADVPQQGGLPDELVTSAQRKVVGVASWLLPEASPRVGQFVVPDVGEPEPAPDRDLSQRRLDLFTRHTEAAEAEYLAGKSICDKLVVHPSYRRRGHATLMLRWGLHVCDQDKVDQGVIPSHMGEHLYVELGYKVIAHIRVPDDGDVKGFPQNVLTSADLTVYTL